MGSGPMMKEVSHSGRNSSIIKTDICPSIHTPTASARDQPSSGSRTRSMVRRA